MYQALTPDERNKLLGQGPAGQRPESGTRSAAEHDRNDIHLTLIIIYIQSN
jgi:hypothetical protein